MKKTNFDDYLEKQLEDPEFAARFKHAGEAWDVALQITALREEAGLSQKELAKRLHTSQQQISRLESPSYEGHSLSMLRRVAEALNMRVKVVFEPSASKFRVAESHAEYITDERRTCKAKKIVDPPGRGKYPARSRKLGMLQGEATAKGDIVHFGLESAWESLR